jgi:uncharacterized protein (DUF885 family)
MTRLICVVTVAQGEAFQDYLFPLEQFGGVDTGIHAKHWTRQQAIDYGMEPSEVERYVVNPGQACSYMLGELKILDLRDKAEKTLGGKFSFKEFHNAAPGAGTLPLDLLERQVDSYVNSAHR